jgi:Uma2 family endonuclease
MATILRVPEQRVLLDNITWDLYERLLAAHRDRSVPRFTYDRGQLEIMSPSAEHEQLKDTLALLVNIVAEEMHLNVEGFGSTTFRREDIARGFEPDACFYITHLAQVKGSTELDLLVDPPPDLVIEIDITNSSLDKFAIFAHVGVPEVWRSTGQQIHIFHLEGSVYVEHEQSAAFQGITSVDISRWLDESRTLERLVWLRRVRAWARTHGSEDPTSEHDAV